jgi:hypothetical protein
MSRSYSDETESERLKLLKGLFVLLKLPLDVCLCEQMCFTPVADLKFRILLFFEEFLRSVIRNPFDVTVTIITGVARHFLQRIAVRQNYLIKNPKDRRLVGYAGIESPRMSTYGA